MAGEKYGLRGRRRDGSSFRRFVQRQKPRHLVTPSPRHLNNITKYYVGYYDGDFDVNPEEVADYEWVDVDFVMKDAKQNPAKYTFWFKEILKSEAFEKFVEKH